MDQCFQILESRGNQLFSDLYRQLTGFYEACRSLTHIRLFTGADEENCFAHDPSKLVISAEALGLSGQKLHDILLHRYHLQLEMAAGHYALALTSLMDRPEGFERLFSALQEIEQQYYLQDQYAQAVHVDTNIAAGTILSRAGSAWYRIPQQKMTIAQALEQPGHTLKLEDAMGAVSQEYMYLYPPGIPLLAPGEVIDELLLEHINQIKCAGLTLEGLFDPTNTHIHCCR